MSQNRNTPPRTRPDLGRPTGRHRSRRDLHARTTEEEQEAVVEGVTGLRPRVPVVEEPYVAARRPGWAATVAAGGAAALAGWILLAAVASLAWLSAPVGSYPRVLGISTQLWLAGHGGGFVAEGTRWTLVPYGLTLLLGVLLAQVSTAVLRRLGDAGDGPAATGLVRSALLALSYAVAVGLTGLFAGGPGQAGRALGGALLLASVAAWWARARTVGRSRTVRWPAWSVELGRALLVGLSVLVVVGAAALVTGLVVHRGSLVLLTEGLGGGVLGGLGAVIAQAAYVPTFVVWAVSYTLGAGFGLGDGSLVSPSETQLGLLPGWPVTAALPTPGPGSPLDLVWLAGGLVAGGWAAWVYLRRSSWTRPDTGMVFGGLVGVLLGLLVTLVGLLSRGDLGVARLTGLGPRPLELLVLGTVLTTAGGLVMGLVAGIVGWTGQRRGARASAATAATDPTPGALASAATAPEGTAVPPAPAAAESEEITGPVLVGESAVFGSLSAGVQDRPEVSPPDDARKDGTETRGDAE